MAYTNPTYRESYIRPKAASMYNSFSRVKVGDISQRNKRIPFVIPASNKLGPLPFWHYAETDRNKGNAALVVGSGYPFMFGTATGGDKVGILVQDAVPSQRVMLETEGTFWMPYDYLGDADATPARVAGTKGTDLSGRPALWMPTIGLVTDQVPDGAGQSYLEIGYFVDAPEIRPDQIQAGIYYAKVRLTNHVNQTAVAWPTVTPSAATNLIDAFPTLNYQVGDTLTVDIVTDAFFNNPLYTVKDSEISWVIDTGGTLTALTGRHINYTGTAGTKACTLDITSNGVTMTQKTFNLVLHATNAPTLTET